jgi:ATPase family associated with various cellular activities (AAA)
MDNLYNQTTLDADSLFEDYFLNAKTVYLHAFKKLPDISYISQIDGEKAFDLLKERFADRIARIFKYRWYLHREKEYQFDSTIVLLNNQCLVEFDNTSCTVYYDGNQQEFVTEITAMVVPFREKQRRAPLEINLVVSEKNALRLKKMEIKRTKLDIDLFYDESFKETDELIRKRLNKKNDKGIVLLHGLPGAGKTSYLRYLIGKIRKKVLFISPSVADNLMNPEFIDLLVNNPNTVLIIEDAENIIMDRKHSSGSSVSNLLNISDGLLADFLNVQLICTFNNSLALIDNALLRKGRLIAKYEFGKLNITQSQRLSDHLGFNTTITRPMTVAEIANQHEKQYDAPEIRAIGFRN